MTPKVSIIMGIASDMGVVEAAAKILDESDVHFETKDLPEVKFRFKTN